MVPLPLISNFLGSDCSRETINLKTIPKTEISENTNWQDALSDVDCVVHLAAMAHKFNKNSPDDLQEYKRVNSLGTKRLLQDVLVSNVKKFIYIS